MAQQGQKIIKTGRVAFAGNITKDVQLQYSGSGTPFVNLNIAASHRFKDEADGQWKDSETEWYRVTAFRDLAERISEAVQKGDRVVVEGSLEVTEREYQGKIFTDNNVIADDIRPSAKWLDVEVRRTERTTPKDAGAAVEPF